MYAGKDSLPGASAAIARMWVGPAVLTADGFPFNGTVALFRARELVAKAAVAVQFYLFRSGGDYSSAICRIFLFSYLYELVYCGLAAYGQNGIARYYETVNLAAYYPK